DIASGWQRMQAFTAGQTGSLTMVSFTAFQACHPDAPLLIEVYPLDPVGQPSGPARTPVTVAAGSVGWAPRAVPVAMNATVDVGLRYGIVVSSTATRGCYGLAFNDAAPYPGGGEAYRSGGSAFVPETGRSDKFWTAVRPAAT